jgi:predicted RNA-binding Zn-ribbon protein involved in translation (DUF1610 family)
MEKIYLCKNCAFKGKAKKMTRGSFAVELLLWCLFIIPGICYTAWRLTNRYTACPRCGAPYMAPVG